MANADTVGAVATLVPPREALPDVLPTDRLNERAKPHRARRDELRHISDARNVVTVLGCLLQTFGVVVGAAWINTWWSYAVAFVLMGRGHVCLNILGHEAAHRLLFTNRAINDAVGRWLLSYPTFTPMLAYRRAHFAHHRDEMGPDEPDASLYAGYPISRASWHRKLRRDATGVSAVKILKGLYRSLRRGQAEASYILVTHVVLLAASIVFMRPLAYLVWFVSWATIWRVLNRLRAIAEHGGMIRSRDRRETTHVIRQTRLARFWIVPYNTGWHLAHHVDMGVPWRNLPSLHDEFVRAGWVTDAIEYPNYRAFWRACSAG